MLTDNGSLGTGPNEITAMQVYLPVAEMTINVGLLLAMGLAVGVLSGLFGIGGGFIVTPMLIFLGVPAAIAVGTGAAQVAASSVSGAVTHWMRRTVDVKMAMVLLMGGVVGSLIGVIMQRWLKIVGQLELFTSFVYVVLLGTVGTLMLIESIDALLRRNAQAKLGAGPVTSSGASRGSHHNWIQRLPLKMRFPASKLYISTIPVVAIGAVVGWLTAIMGVGGGFLLVPALIYLLRMPTRIVIGTSVFQIMFVTALTTVLQSWQNQSVDLLLGLPLMIGGVIGAQYGVRLGQHMQAEQLRIFLALLVLAVGIRMLVELAVPPREIYSIESNRL
jgi:uncharacterized protein